jgi:hypothetical protein
VAMGHRRGNNWSGRCLDRVESRVATSTAYRHRPNNKWALDARHFLDVAVSALVIDDDANQGEQMGKIIMSENLSLDGVVQDPTGEGGLQRRRLVRPGFK